MSNANLYTLFQQRFPKDADALFLDSVDGRQLRYSEIPSTQRTDAQPAATAGREKG